MRRLRPARGGAAAAPLAAAIDALNPHYLRAKAFVILGLAASRLDDNRLRKTSAILADAYERTAGDDWRWFEDHMTYCNARLPQALFAALSPFS